MQTYTPHAAKRAIARRTNTRQGCVQTLAFFGLLGLVNGVGGHAQSQATKVVANGVKQTREAKERLVVFVESLGYCARMTQCAHTRRAAKRHKVGTPVRGAT